MRLLDAKKVPYESFHYMVDETNTDGTLMARMNGRNSALVHKTLVAISSKKQLYVFIIPIDKELDLKKAAQACGEKKVEMLPHKELLRYTGYIKGGCSPLGMKKLYPTYLEESSLPLEKVIVSGGKKGHIIEIGIDHILQTVDGELKELIKEE